MDAQLAKEKACAMRKDIIEMLHAAGSGHPGGSLSCTDILSSLYFGGVMHHDPKNPSDNSRDRFILAKGYMRHLLCMLFWLRQVIFLTKNS